MRKSSSMAAACAALALAACAGSRDESAVSRGTVLVDARNGGAAGFFFLPPVAPEPNDATPNHRGLSPVVEIEELSPGTAGIVATFAEASVEDLGAHYQVSWATTASPLSPGLTYRIRVHLSGVVLGWADAALAADGSELRFLFSDETFPLTGERTVPIKFRIAEPALDADADLVPDASDDCPNDPDSIQVDSDGDGTGDACECVGVVCAPVDACHLGGACDPGTGTCSTPLSPDGTPCPLEAGTGVCQGGLCVAPPSSCGTCTGCAGGCGCSCCCSCSGSGMEGGSTGSWSGGGMMSWGSP